MTELDDRDLLARIARHDQLAMQSLHERYRLRLWRYLWSLLGRDNAWVEDVLQEVFLAVWRGAASFRGDAQVATWIYHLARHLAINARRDRARRPEGHLVNQDDAEVDDAEWQHASHEDAVVNRMTLAAAMRQLTPKHREVIELVFYHGFLLGEIAAILDVPVGTIKSRLSYARRALYSEMTINGERE